MAEQELRLEMVSILEELFAAQLITPTGGNLSVRITDEEDAFLVTPTMLYKGRLTPEDIVKVNSAGKPANRRQRPSVETPMHLAIYAAHLDVEGIIHSHAPLSTALGLVGGKIPAITVDAAPFIGTQIVPYGLPGTPELIRNVVQALEHSPAVLLQCHGLLTGGWTLRQAANRALAVEEVVRILLACRLFGQEPATLPEEALAFLQAAGVA